jgi:hypothetical protein
MRWIRIIRDPFKRAVSSYRHIMLIAYDNERIGAHLGRTVTKTAGYSFMEFLSYLSAIDLANCDIHYCQQYNPIEKYVSPIVLNIDRENAETELVRIQGLLKLPPLSRREVSDLKAERARVAANFHAQRGGADGADVSNRRFDAETSPRQWPAYSAFLTPESRRLVFSLYALDYAAYHEHLTQAPAMSLATRLWAKARNLMRTLTKPGL